MMKNSKLLRYGLPIAGALVVAFAAIAVTASAAGVSFNLSGSTRTSAIKTAATTPTPPSGHGDGAGKADLAAYCASFMKNFAGDLKVSQDAVDAAAKKALGQTVDQAVSDGKLTAAEATKIKAAIPAGTLCSAAASGLPGIGPGGPAGPGAGRHGAGELGVYLGAYLDAAAKAAGLSGGATELKTAMAAGQSLSAIAKAHGIDEPTFRKNLIANLTPTLDAAVSSGKLTVDQEKGILSKLQNGPIPFWNGRPAGPPGTPPSGAAVPPAA